MTRHTGSRALSVALSFAAALAILSAPGPAHADDTGVWKAFKGKILISDKPFEGSYPSDGAMISAYKKQQKNVVTNAGGTWTFNMMLFLNEPAGATGMNVVYYDLTTKSKEADAPSDITVEPTQRSVILNGTSLSKENGLVPGHKYEVRATRIIGGKEKVFAKATITLK